MAAPRRHEPTGHRWHRRGANESLRRERAVRTPSARLRRATMICMSIHVVHLSTVLRAVGLALAPRMRAAALWRVEGVIFCKFA